MSDNLAYQEDFRQELIGGRIVAMSPRPAFNHNRVAENIDFIFRTYLWGKPCVPMGDGYDLYLTPVDHFIPDFMVVCDPNKIKADGIHGAPDLVVEVLSPGTAWNDKTHKKAVYAKCGVREYWLVNPVDCSVEIFRLENSDLVPQSLYYVYPDWMLARMTEEERANVVTEFRCSLFDDLTISMSDIFCGLLP